MPEFRQTALMALHHEDDSLIVCLGGNWLLSTACRPGIGEIALNVEEYRVRRIAVDGTDLKEWDSCLILFLFQLDEYCRQQQLELNVEAAPQGAQRLLRLATAVTAQAGPTHAAPSWLERIGLKVQQLAGEAHEFTHFIGEASLSAFRFLIGRGRHRRRDLGLLLEECGPNALPIVTLIALLVGLVLAYVGAVQLQMFGAQVYVANLVELGMLREMGAMMTAVIMAGRTGSAYAAQLGTMQVNQEIDALRTLGVSPMDFLILPRMLALIVMVPLLTVYANLVGIFGGALAAVSVFDLTLLEYAHQTRAAFSPNHATVGLIKAAVFGVLIATAGCLRGIQCQRSAQAVGEAATSAVVTGIVAIVVADALLTILFTQLNF